MPDSITNRSTYHAANLISNTYGEAHSCYTSWLCNCDFLKVWMCFIFLEQMSTSSIKIYSHSGISLHLKTDKSDNLTPFLPYFVSFYHFWTQKIANLPLRSNLFCYNCTSKTYLIHKNQTNALITSWSPTGFIEILWNLSRFPAASLPHKHNGFVIFNQPHDMISKLKNWKLLTLCCQRHIFVRVE